MEPAKAAHPYAGYVLAAFRVPGSFLLCLVYHATSMCLKKEGMHGLFELMLGVVCDYLLNN